MSRETDTDGDFWAVERCGFLEAGDALEASAKGADSPIAVIDVGNGALGHRWLQNKVTEQPTLQAGDRSTALHASAVIGTIVSACSAKVDFYNAWTTTGFDLDAFLAAIEDVIASGARVLNLSVGSPERHPAIEAAIARCIAADVVVVAATGDYDEDRITTALYPASLDDVIAVGATNRHDRRRRGSGIGKNDASGNGKKTVWIAAPGERIWTVISGDALGYRDGTSFATALVSAAAWLIIRNRPDLDVAAVREILARCVDGKSVPPGVQSEELGHGRLDVRNLAALLRNGARGNLLHASV